MNYCTTCGRRVDVGVTEPDPNATRCIRCQTAELFRGWRYISPSARRWKERTNAMPMQTDRYPADWPAIALRIKNDSGWICRDCGMQCRKPGEPFDTHKRTMSVHHLGAPRDDGSPGDMHDKMDVRDCNLIALCAKCHLARDLPGHMANAAKTRRNKKIEAGQAELF